MPLTSSIASWLSFWYAMFQYSILSLFPPFHRIHYILSRPINFRNVEAGRPITFPSARVTCLFKVNGPIISPLKRFNTIVPVVGDTFSFWRTMLPVSINCSIEANTLCVVGRGWAVPGPNFPRLYLPITHVSFVIHADSCHGKFPSSFTSRLPQKRSLVCETPAFALATAYDNTKWQRRKWNIDM